MGSTDDVPANSGAQKYLAGHLRGAQFSGTLGLGV